MVRKVQKENQILKCGYGEDLFLLQQYGHYTNLFAKNPHRNNRYTNCGMMGHDFSTFQSKKKTEEANLILSENEEDKKEDESRCSDHVTISIDDGGEGHVESELDELGD